MPARIIVLTGERGVGKTTVCRKVAALAQARGYACGGILTLSRSTDDRDVLDVGSGRVRRLTLRPEPRDETLEPGTSQAVIQGRFCFDPETLAWGNDALARAWSCHLLVVDELGPLEMEREGGWVKAFDVLRQAGFTLALVVIRPELLAQARLKLPALPTTMVAVTLDNRDGLPVALLETLEGELASILQTGLQAGQTLVQHP